MSTDINNPDSPQDPLVWVIADDKAGHRNQAIGVAKALGYPFVTKHLHYNRFAALPNVLKFGLMGIDRTRSDVLLDPWPDIIISAGRRTLPVARYIKHQTQGKAFWTNIMWPAGKRDDIDLIAAPAHDEKTADNVVTIVGAPHNITPDFLAEQMQEWQDAFDHVTQPVITLLIGGNAGNKQFTTKHAHELLTMASTLTESIKGTLLVSTSRRTPQDVVDIFANNLKCRHVFFDPNQEKDNPYFAFLHIANSIIITGDSISMCSEAASLGKPTFIYAPDTMTPEKHQKMHATLFKNNYASPFTVKRLGTIEQQLKNPHTTALTPRLNSAITVADAIKARYTTSK